jgi:hypothetical protein
MSFGLQRVNAHPCVITVHSIASLFRGQHSKYSVFPTVELTVPKSTEQHVCITGTLSEYKERTNNCHSVIMLRYVI